MAAPPIAERHKHHFHRQSPIKESVRAATTANITISTALNNGDTLDGVTLATGDRVLVKDQSTGSQNGIYVVGASPARDYDVSTDDPAFGYLVLVREGTANAGTLWENTNTSAPTIGSTTLTFSQFSGSGAPTGADYLVGTSQAGLSAEIVVGTTPGGELGGTWASPTVDATHAGSTHVALSSATPLVESGAGSAGSGTAASKDDHVHPAAGGSGTLSTVEEVDGSPTDSAVTKLVFPNGTLSIASHVATYTPTGGGGGLTVQYPALKPGTPTYDFAGASLDAAFGAHSSQGSFGTGNCMTQGASPWPGTTLEMQFSGQMGVLTLTHADTDLDFTWGGISSLIGDGNNQIAFGIAALDTSGNGIIVVSETNDVYFGKATSWNFATVLASWGNGHGAGTLPSMKSADFWFRLKRVSGTWTAYASSSGRTWDKTFPTDATSYTVATLNFGLLYNTGTAYTGRILSDYIQVDV